MYGMTEVYRRHVVCKHNQAHNIAEEISMKTTAEM